MSDFDDLEFFSPTHPKPTFRVSLFETRESNDLTPAVWTLEDMQRELLHHRPAKHKEDVSLWSPCWWKPGEQRGYQDLENGRLDSISCFVADIDGKVPIADLRSRWVTPDGKPLTWFLYTSFNHQSEAPRYRVVFPLAQPEPADHWKVDFWPRASLYLTDNHTDVSKKNASALYYRPSCQPENLAEAVADFSIGVLLRKSFLPPLPEKPKRERAPSVGAPLDLSDAELIGKMLGNPKNGAAIRALWDGDTSRHDNNGSRADAALMEHLAWWCNGDRARMENLFGQSQAAQREKDKWFTRPDYRERTINYALNVWDGEGYQPGQKPQAKVYHGPTPSENRRGDQPQSETGEETPPPTKTRKDTSRQPAGPRPLTDLGNAERLIDRHGQDLRYNPSTGYLVWVGDRFQVDQSGQVERWAKETVRAIYSESAGMAEKIASLNREMVSVSEADSAKVKEIENEIKGLEAQAREIRAWAKKSEAKARIDAMIALAQTEEGVYVALSELDADPMLLNCQNGTLDLRTATLQPHERANLITKIIPVAYDPDATCPLWDSCLQTWQPEGERRAFIARAFGYSLTGQTGEETLFFLYGDGRNGKTKLTAALEFVMGDYATRLRAEIIMAGKKDAGGVTPDLAALHGARVVIVSEVQEGHRLDEALVKDLTGGDTISVNPKYKEPFKFRPLFKAWLYGNHKPIIRGTDSGIRSRLPLIPFTVKIPIEKRDIHLDAKLQTEGAGILAWAVRGCLAWQSERLSPPASVIEATEKYHAEQDQLGLFLKDCCLLAPGDEAKYARTGQLRAAYEEYCHDKGEAPRVNGNAYAERLVKAGLKAEQKRIEKGMAPMRIWVGVSLLSERDPEEKPKTVPPVPPVPSPPEKSESEKNAPSRRGFPEPAGTAGTAGTEVSLAPPPPQDPFSEDGGEIPPWLPPPSNRDPAEFPYRASVAVNGRWIFGDRMSSRDGAISALRNALIAAGSAVKSAGLAEMDAGRMVMEGEKQ